MYKKFSFILASVFGVGYCPFASGTAGSLVTIPLAFFCAYNYGLTGIIFATIISFFIGVIASKEVLKYTKHDPSLIVIDEVSGQLLTFAFVADKLQNTTENLWLYLVGFILFRIFDITKPQPVRFADKKISNAWGVMLDDILAGLYAATILYAISHYKI